MLVGLSRARANHIWLVLIYAKNSTHFNANQHTNTYTLTRIHTHKYLYVCMNMVCIVCIAVCKVATLPVAKLCYFHGVSVLFLRKITFLYHTLTHTHIFIYVWKCWRNVKGKMSTEMMMALAWLCSERVNWAIDLMQQASSQPSIGKFTLKITTTRSIVHKYYSASKEISLCFFFNR